MEQRTEEVQAMPGRLIVLVALAVGVLAVVVLVPAIEAQIAPSSARTADICATVVSVEKLDFPSARIRLRVSESSRANVLDARSRPREITVRNYLRTSGGKVDFQNRENIGAIGAYYLLQGDEIRGKLFSGSSTPGRNDDWYLYAVERTKGGSMDAPMTSTKVQGNLRLTFSVALRGASEPVQLSLTVENTGAASEVLRFSSGQQYDFIVSTDGREVWRWSAGRMFIQALTSFTLSPGEKKTFTAAWPRTYSDGKRVGSGVYDIQGVLTSTSPPRQAVGPVAVTIGSRQ